MDSGAKGGLAFIGTLMVVGGLIAGQEFWRSKSGPSTWDAQPSRPPIVSDPIAWTGDLAILKRGSEIVYVATTKQNFDDFYKYMTANDRDGWIQLIAQGKVLPVESGTACRVIEGGFMTDEVRIQEGNYAHQSGIVASEFVKKASRP